MPTLLIKAAFLISISALMLISACQEPEKPEPKTGELKISVLNHFNGTPIILDTKEYPHPSGYPIAITRLQYYLSNFSFECKECGSQEGGDIYELISIIDDPNLGGIYKDTSFTVDLQIGTYEQLSLALGVDEERNNNGPYEGDLDFKWSMNWSWSGDYIFYKIEGEYEQTQDSALNDFVFHLGGNGAYRETTLNAPSPIEIKEGEVTEMTLYVNIAEFLDNPYSLDFKEQNTMMSPGPNANKIADNFPTLFSLSLE